MRSPLPCLVCGVLGGHSVEVHDAARRQRNEAVEGRGYWPPLLGLSAHLAAEKPNNGVAREALPRAPRRVRHQVEYPAGRLLARLCGRAGGPRRRLSELAGTWVWQRLHDYLAMEAPLRAARRAP